MDAAFLGKSSCANLTHGATNLVNTTAVLVAVVASTNTALPRLTSSTDAIMVATGAGPAVPTKALKRCVMVECVVYVALEGEGCLLSVGACCAPVDSKAGPDHMRCWLNSCNAAPGDVSIRPTVAVLTNSISSSTICEHEGTDSNSGPTNSIIVLDKSVVNESGRSTGTPSGGVPTLIAGVKAACDNTCTAVSGAIPAGAIAAGSGAVFNSSVHSPADAVNGAVLVTRAGLTCITT